MLKDDPISNVLYINLTKREYRVVKREELFEKYIGGAGIASQLLLDECPAGCDPLSPDNPIIFSVGPLTGLFPLASKTVAMFKSPHNGGLGESHCGGRSAVAIRMAGYGAVVIKGASDIPVYISIHGNRVHFRDARALWGMRGSVTAGRIIRQNEPGKGMRSIMRIGVAGERLVSYANVTSETFRHFGRMGLGAVFGSKKLKAVVISGKRTLPVADFKEYRRVYDEIFDQAVRSESMKKYHDLGTAENILPLNELGGFPTRNLKTSRFEGADGISGEIMAERYLERRLACSHCPVGCIHLAALREPYENEAYFYKTSMVCYDYEPIYSIGAMLGISEPAHFLTLMDQVESLGIDVMTAGVALAWATEAFEKGLISEKETMGLKFEWGNYRIFIEALKRIVTQPNDFYKALSRGVDHASMKYGGADFALAFGGVEMPGYHTGPGAHLGFLVGARHSHLDNAGYSIDQKEMKKSPLSPVELVDKLLAEERWRQILSSLVICFFARKIYSPELTVAALRAAGFDFTTEDLTRIGTKIHNEKYRFKFREGFSFDKLRIPNRIFETPSPLGKIDEKFMRDAIEYVRTIF